MCVCVCVCVGEVERRCLENMVHGLQCKLKWAGIVPATNCIQLKLVFSLLGGKNLVQQICLCRIFHLLSIISCML